VGIVQVSDAEEEAVVGADGAAVVTTVVGAAVVTAVVGAAVVVVLVVGAVHVPWSPYTNAVAPWAGVHWFGAVDHSA